VCSGVEERCVVMSKDQVSVKCDSSTDVETSSSSALVSPAAVVNDDDDENEEDTEASVGMQFATETIVRNFSRCISGSSTIHTVLIRGMSVKTEF